MKAALRAARGRLTASRVPFAYTMTVPLIRPALSCRDATSGYWCRGDTSANVAVPSGRDLPAAVHHSLRGGARRSRRRPRLAEGVGAGSWPGPFGRRISLILTGRSYDVLRRPVPGGTEAQGATAPGGTAVPPYAAAPDGAAVALCRIRRGGDSAVVIRGCIASTW